MLLLQFSTSPYCRKVRLALGYKQISYQVRNLIPGVHRLQLQPLTGLSTVPVLLLDAGDHVSDRSSAIADSTAIVQFLEQQYPIPALIPDDPDLTRQAWMIEDWLDESIGIATRFVYYHFRCHEGRFLDQSWLSPWVIRLACQQYGINAATARLAAHRLKLSLEWLEPRWQAKHFALGSSMTIADLTAAALLSPLALIPTYRQSYPWLWNRISLIHDICHEAPPPGLSPASEALTSYRRPETWL